MWSRIIWALVCLLAGCVLVQGQTRVDLSKQGREIDFSAAPATKPFRSVAALPSSCQVGDVVFKTGAEAGRNVHLCTNPNEWTEVRPAVEVAALPATPGQVLTGQTSGTSWSSLGGDLGGGVTSAVVRGLQGRALAERPPQHGQSLVWDAVASEWAPATAVAGGASGGGGSSFLVGIEGAASATVAGSEHNLGTAALYSVCLDNSNPRRMVSGYELLVDSTTYDVEFRFPAAFTGVCALSGGSAGVVSINGRTEAAQTLAGSAFITISSGPGGHEVGLAGTQGEGDRLATVTANPADGCAAWASGTLTTTGQPCGTGSGGGTTEVSLTAGPGIALSGDIVSVDTAAVPSYLTRVVNYDSPAVAGGACQSTTFTLAGALPGDAVAAGWPGDLETGLTGRMLVTAGDTVQMMLCNMTGAAIDPPSRVYRAMVIRSF